MSSTSTGSWTQYDLIVKIKILVHFYVSLKHTHYISKKAVDYFSWRWRLIFQQFVCVLYVPVFVRSFACSIVCLALSITYWFHYADQETYYFNYLSPLFGTFRQSSETSMFPSSAGKPREVETGKIIALSELSNFERTIEQDRKSRGTKTLITCWQTWSTNTLII